MYITPKKRLMSITNALATQKYIAYSTEIDLEKAKVEDDGTILAGSPYPFSQTIEFPVRNYVIDSQYKNSEFIEEYYNRDSSFKNKYYTNYSVIHQNVEPFTSEIEEVNGELVIKLTSTITRGYQLMIVNDLVEPIRMNKLYTRSISVDLGQRVNKLSFGFTMINGRGVGGGGSFTQLYRGSYRDNPSVLSVKDVQKHTGIANDMVYGCMIVIEGNITAGIPVYFTIKEMMIYEGHEDHPYYPAVEDFPAGGGEPAMGLMFNDINVKEELKRGIKAVTGKIITSGYVLEDRLPYEIHDSTKENLNMIRFR